jgi:hypothetical protein
VEDADYFDLDSRTSRSSSFEPHENEATLTLDRPVPGFAFGIRWNPGAWEPEGGVK